MMVDDGLIMVNDGLINYNYLVFETWAHPSWLRQQFPHIINTPAVLRGHPWWLRFPLKRV